VNFSTEEDIWRDGSGNQASLALIIETLKLNPKSKIHAGCDSHFTSGNNVVFAVVICMHYSTGGGKYFFKRINEPAKRYTSLGTRLFKEVEFAIQAAQSLKNNKIVRPILVHADINVNPAEKSSKFAGQIKNYIMAMGFNFTFKPLAWASSSVADRHAK